MLPAVSLIGCFGLIVCCDRANSASIPSSTSETGIRYQLRSKAPQDIRHARTAAA